MNAGNGSVTRSNRIIPSGAPFTVGSARNGLSVDATGRIVLGQDVGQIGNPAILLNNREIPMGGQNFALGNATDPIGIFIDSTNRQIIAGDVNFVNNVTQLFLDDTNRQAGIGDINFIGNRTSLYLDDLNQTADLRTGTIDIECLGTSPFGIDRVTVFIGSTKRFLLLDKTNRLYEIGDINGANNGTFLQVDDTNKLTRVLAGVNPYLSIDVANGVFTLGDLNGATGNNLLYLDTTQFTVQLGNPLATVINMGSLAGRYVIGATNFGNQTKITIDDRVANQLITLQAGTALAQGVAIPGGATFLHLTTALTNNAGASAGTLNNAPAAGNPTKWIRIDDAGTARFIPAW